MGSVDQLTLDRVRFVSLSRRVHSFEQKVDVSFSDLQ